MKQLELTDIEQIKLGEFNRAYKEIAEAKEIVAITRFRSIDGYYVPATMFEELVKKQEIAKE